MKKRFYVLLFILFFTTVALFSSNVKKLFQFSTINALMIGQYDGHLSIDELKKYGNFGIGTFNRLDGELLAVNNEFYQIDYKGNVNKMSDDVTTPFAAVTFFESDTEIQLQNINSFSHLQKEISKYLPTHNIFFALKIEGSFKYVKTRSVPPQSKPYPRLLSIANEQPEFEYEDVSGLLVGFYTPEYIININVPGYHLHFITEDKTGGGHLLDCVIEDATLKISFIHSFEMLLPNNSVFYNTDLLNVEEGELHKIEN